VLRSTKSTFSTFGRHQRCEHAALVAGTAWVAHARHEDDVGVRRVDDDAADLLDVAQADVPPRSSAVGGLEDAVADAEIRTMKALAAANVDDIGVDGATATSPTEPVGALSKIGRHVRP
jgi:hypothetical protein